MSVPFYKQKKDALEDVGITARQESHWRRSGLYEPEIGEGRFTEIDIKILNFLRYLITSEDRKGRKGLGLSVETVKQLLDKRPTHTVHNADGETCEVPVPIAWLADPLNQDYHARHIDYVARELVTFEQVFYQFLSRVWARDLFTVDAILMLTFAHLERLNSLEPKVYEAHRESLFDRIREMDLIVRARADEEAQFFGYVPALRDDPSPQRVIVKKDDGSVSHSYDEIYRLQRQREWWERRLARMAGKEDYLSATVPF